MKKIHLFLLACIACLLLAGLAKKTPVTEMTAQDVQSHDSVKKICFKIPNLQLKKWRVTGDELLLFPIKHSSVLTKSDFELVCRNGAGGFLTRNGKISEKTFEQKASNYIKYLRINKVPKSDIPYGYKVNAKTEDDFEACITLPDYLDRMMIVSYRDTVCCHCPPICGDPYFRQIVLRSIETQYK